MDSIKKKGLSAAVLKNIAVIVMLIDHLTAFLLKSYLKTQGILNVYNNEFYYAGRVIGRIAFVLYAFMIAEGALKTRNKLKYALRLLALAIISIVPHSYANNRSWFNPDDLNIFFLLFFGLLNIYAYEWLKQNVRIKWLCILLQLASTAAASAISLEFHFEYGMMGILLILVFYIWRYDTPKMFFFETLVMTIGYAANVVLSNGAATWFARHSSDILGGLISADRIQVFGILAFPLIYFYNGQKGKQLPKAFYYFFYPVHLAIIGLINVYLM